MITIKLYHREQEKQRLTFPDNAPFMKALLIHKRHGDREGISPKTQKSSREITPESFEIYADVQNVNVQNKGEK